MSWKRLIIAVLFLTTTTFAGTTTVVNTTWNGIARQYELYTPPCFVPGNPMVFYLHPATEDPHVEPYQVEFKTQAEANCFLLVWPASTFNTQADQWVWEVYDIGFSFSPSPAPDDAGFLRSVILALTAQYSINQKAIFVTGLFTGAQMAQRMGVQSGDLIAAIAPVTGSIFQMQMTDSFTIPAPAAPVSVLEYHGDEDTDQIYCGASPHNQWGQTSLTLASVDQAVNYWLSSDGLPPNPTPLCTNGSPSPGVDGVDEADNGIEVKFIREIGLGHVNNLNGSGLPDAIWSFFSTHFKPQ